MAFTVGTLRPSAEGFSSDTLKNALLGATSFIGICVAAQPAVAQVADEQSTQVETDEDVIVVSGLRQALADALNDKRDSGNVSDGISAEDIGKTTDQNIGEALGRVPGVSLSRQDGEGTQITVRGVGSDLNNISLNGVALTSSGENQGVNLSEFSADVLSSIRVIKTASANQNEGSLGAVVELKGFRPLDTRRNRTVLEIQGRQNSFIDPDGFRLKNFFNGDRKISGAFSRKFFDRRVGISIVASSETSTVRTDAFEIGNIRPSEPADGAINLATGEIITEFDYGPDIGVQPLRGHANRLARYVYKIGERDRDNISGTLQFLIGDSTDVQFDYTWSQQKLTNDAVDFQINTELANDDAGSIIFDPSTLTFVEHIQVADGNRDRAGFIASSADLNAQTQTSNVFSGRITREAGPFTFELSGGQSKTKSRQDAFSTLAFQINRGQRGTGFASGYSCIGPDFEICPIVLEDTFNPDLGNLADRPDEYRPQRYALRDRKFDDKITSLFFDVDWEAGFGPIQTIQAGLKFSERSKFSNQTNTAIPRGVYSSLPNADAFLSDRTVPSDWGERLGFPRDGITDGWFLADAAAFNTALEELTPLIPQLDLGNTNDITETIYGGYIQADYELFSGDVIGDLGVRVVRTEIDSIGFSGVSYASIDFLANAADPFYVDFYGSVEAAEAALGPNTFDLIDGVDNLPPFAEANGTNEYTNILPSLNVNWLATDDIIVRFAASRTMARPRISDLNGSIEINERIFSVTSVGNAGSPGLKPFLSDNLDLSFEWYFDRDSLFSVALFNKKLKDFAERTSILTYYRDLRPDLYDANGVALAEPLLVPTPQNVLLPLSGGPGQAGCMPERFDTNTGPVSEPGCDLLVLRQARNGAGGYVRGAEVTFQHNFTWLPGFLSGFGISANYTYADSQADEELGIDDNGNSFVAFPESPFPDTSKHTFNATAFYEKGGLLVRLAYNTRSDFLISRAGEEGYAIWQEGGDSLDLSIGYDITKNVSLNFQAVNLTDDVRRRYTTNVLDVFLPTEPTTFSTPIKSRTSELENTGTIYRFGARFSF